MATRENQTTINLARPVKDRLELCRVRGETWDHLLEDMLEKASAWEEEHDIKPGVPEQFSKVD